jgi:hypothetical protein
MRSSKGGGLMGKAAERRNERRRKFLAKLSQEDPERFEHEWAKRLESWAGVIWCLAKDGNIQTPPVFEVVDKAKKILTECGERAVELQFKETDNVLSNECCRTLSSHIGLEIYRITQRWKPKE